ncbi:hypothetical protein LCI18_014982 [Fusarium solani-melongenae]|uniref:Uncharacterized protein n=1 Tax=Fusarium solani subsp. cucurbitae TaxID=2747967 RepID=A0ACD3ZSD8_FUSSC|nr:hypothetical protein LCI18_014982 [Fusarium solani-melongenae]
MPPDNDPACSVQQRCARCSRIPWRAEIWELLATFRKSRDSEHYSNRLDEDSLDDLDFALDALRQQPDPSANEHNDEGEGAAGLGSLRPSQVKRLGVLVQHPCDGDQGARISPERATDLRGKRKGKKEQIKIVIYLRYLRYLRDRKRRRERATTAYFNHHPNSAALEQAAAIGCYLCRTLRAGAIHAAWKTPLDVIATVPPRIMIRYGTSEDGTPAEWALDLERLSRPGEIKDETDRFSMPKSLSRETLDTDLECLARDVIRPWVDDCDAGKSDHQYCQSVTARNPDYLPTRLIDVGTCQEDPVRLVVTSEDIPKVTEPPKYLTLSYCWGKSNSPAKTTPQNYEKRRENIDTESLPLTIQDAIRLTRVMKIRYLWVDALCIIQNLEDFYMEATKMEAYYAGGYCLISASGFSDSSEGLFPHRQIGKYLTRTYTFGYDDRSGRYLVLKNPTERLLREACGHQPVLKRAWCLQERLLSPRILHITPEAVFWQCHSIPEISEFNRSRGLQPSENEMESRIARTADEWGASLGHSLMKTEKLKSEWLQEAQAFKDIPPRSFGAPVLRTTYDSVMSQSSLVQMWLAWKGLIQWYLHMELSYEDDRLTAIQGLGHRLAKQHGDRYFGGIFLSYLAHGLLWKGEKRPRGQRSTRCPTWSWGVAKSVEFIPLERSLVSGIGNDSVFPPSNGMIEMISQETRSLHLRVPLVPMAKFQLQGSPALKTSAIWVYRDVEFTLYFDEENLVPCDLHHVKVILLGYTEGCESLVGLVVRNSMESYRYVERTGYVEVKAMDSLKMGTTWKLDKMFEPWMESVNLV